MQCLQQSAASCSSHAEMSVYMLNCLYKAKTTLSVFEFTEEKLEMLSGQMDAHLDTLINEQVLTFLTVTGLLFAYNKHTNKDTNFSDLDIEKLKKAANSLDRVLANPDQFMLAQCRMIVSATLREAVINRSHSYFAQVYSQMYSFLESLPCLSQTDLSQITRHPDQVRSLLV